MPERPPSDFEQDLATGRVRYDPERDTWYEATTWAPVDLTAALAGEGVPPPVYLPRTDGVRLVYAGRRHAFWGASETFKSWLAVLACRSVIDAGGVVIYLDFEDDEVGFVDKARTLGIPDAEMRRGGRLLYVQPEERLRGDAALADALDLRNRHPALVVIDGVTEAMALHGLHPNDPKDTAEYQHLLPRSWEAAATIEIDHTSKSGTAGQFGSQQKRAGIDGLSCEVRAVQNGNRGRGHLNLVDLFVEKDRHGHVRREALDGKKIGQFHLDTRPDREGPAAYIEPAPARTFNEAREVLRELDVRDRVLDFVAAHAGASTTEIREGVTGRATAINDALARLVEDGELVVEARGRSRYHTLGNGGTSSEK